MDIQNLNLPQPPAKYAGKTIQELYELLNNGDKEAFEDLKEYLQKLRDYEQARTQTTR